MALNVVSKSRFAELIGVSPGRVSQYISSGQISAAAIVGHGQRAKLDVDRAKADLRLTLDVSQLLGNGVDTDLGDKSGQGSEPTRNEPRSAGLDGQIKQAKLEQLLRANRNAAIAEASAAGKLMDADEARAQMSRNAVAMLDIFEGALNELAASIAGEFKLPQRDVKHFTKRSFRSLREAAANQMRQRSVLVPETSSVEIVADDVSSEQVQ